MKTDCFLKYAFLFRWNKQRGYANVYPIGDMNFMSIYLLPSS